MSIYLLVFLLLAAGTLLEYFRPQIKTYAYWICWAAMTGCLCFRFGQGTDYVTYQGLYETIPVAIDCPRDISADFIRRSDGDSYLRHLKCLAHLSGYLLLYLVWQKCCSFIGL